MTCTEIEKLLPLYVSGELEAPRVAALVAHLCDCRSCARRLEQQSEFDARLRKSVMNDELDTSALERRVRECIAAEAAVLAWPRRLALATRRLAAAAAVAAALVLAGGLGYRVLFAPEATRVYADAAQDHQREVVEREPRAWQYDPQTIGALVEKQGVPAAATAALAAAGYRLERAKLCRLNGRVFLHLAYTGGGESEFSVFLRQREEGAPSRTNEAAYHTLAYAQGLGSEYVAAFAGARCIELVVTGQSRGDAQRLARIAAGAL